MTNLITFEEWLVQEIAVHHENNDKDMIKHLNANTHLMQKAWQACEQQNQAEMDALKYDLDGYMKIAHASATEIVQQEKTIVKLVRALKEVISANPTIVFDKPEAFKYVSSIEKARKAIAEAEGKEG